MGAPRPNYGYRPLPQMSANQIAEYLSATAPRRRDITQQAKFPKTSVVSQYVLARDGISSFLNDGTRSYRHLAEALDRLTKRQTRTGATEWLVNDSRNSIEAIDVFAREYIN
jgi:hypothetical protein